MAEWLRIPVTTTGAAGSASGEAFTQYPAAGAIVAGFDIKYHASAPNTTDVTISEELPGGALRTLLTLTDGNTSVFKAVQVASVDSTNTATGGYVPLVVVGRIKVVVAQCDALTNAVVVSAQII